MNEKIILVDDDNHILTSVSVALRNEGWQVETYPDGEKGLIALQKNIPDLVILDIKMPRIDGMEMLKRLRISSNVPVIFLTSKDEEIDEIITIVKPVMENAHLPIKPLNVKLSVDYGFAKNWADAH